jgi:uncharacterized protein YndB with AHSA1/START domain
VEKVEVVRRFAAPPQAVWDVYTDHARWSEWAGFPGSRLERQGAPQPNGVGAVRCFGAGPFRVYEEVLGFEPPKRMTYRVTRGFVPLRNHAGEVRFEPEGGGTRVTWRCRFDPSLPGLGGVLRAGITRSFRRALEGLARHHFPDRPAGGR